MSQATSWKGRASRSEFWYFTLFTVLCYLGGVVLIFLAGKVGLPFALVAVLFFVAYAAVLVPTIGVTVRRLHDTGRSGWWYFICLIPGIGGIILLVMTASATSAAGDKFGESDASLRASFKAIPDIAVWGTPERATAVRARVDHLRQQLQRNEITPDQWVAEMKQFQDGREKNADWMPAER